MTLRLHCIGRSPLAIFLVVALMLPATTGLAPAVAGIVKVEKPRFVPVFAEPDVAPVPPPGSKRAFG